MAVHPSTPPPFDAMSFSSTCFGSGFGLLRTSATIGIDANAFGWTGQDAPVRVMSFSWVALRRILRLAADLELVMLVETRPQWVRVKTFIDNDWILGPGIEMTREHPELVSKMRETGRRVHCWVVNDPADIDLCVELGVEAVITDRPGATMAHLRKREG